MKIKLGEALRYEQPTKYIVASEKYNDSYAIPVLTAGKSFILGYTNENSGIYDNLPVIIFDDFTTDIKYVDFPFKVKSSAMKMLQPANENYNLKFFYYLIKYMNFQPTSHQRHWISKFAEMEFDIPERVKQDQIVEKLDKLVEMQSKKTTQLKKYDDLVKSQFIEMFGEIDNNIFNWDKKLFGDIVSISRGASPRPIENYLTNDSDGINWIKIGDVNENSLYIEKTLQKITQAGAEKSRYVKIGDFILSNSMSFGRPYILKINGCVHDGWLIISDYDKYFNKYFLYFLLRSDSVNSQFKAKATGGVVNNLNSDKVKNTIVFIPPIELQNKFADFVKHIDKLKLNDMFMGWHNEK